MLFWALTSCKPQLEAAGQGTTFIELSRDKLKSERIPLPDLETQKAIADFLDRETARIDQLIEKKKKLVELVDEKRMAMIVAAVTSKIDPATGQHRSASAFEGGSGVSLTAFRKLKYIAPVVTLKVPYDNVDRPYVGLEHITSWTGYIQVDSEATPDGLVLLFEPGDVLFGKLRPYLAKVALADFSGACSTEVLVLRPRKNAWPRYLQYVLSNKKFIDDVNSSTYGAKMPRASWEFVGSRRIPLPDLETQKAIVDFLDRETVKLDRLKTLTNQLIDRLREFRSALITAAVTGQINVATWGKSGEAARRLDKIQEASA